VIPVVVGLLTLVVVGLLNVAIHRVPLRRSVAPLSSRCPFCGTLIRAFGNIPVLGALLPHPAWAVPELQGTPFAPLPFDRGYNIYISRGD
jgi:hypothetical protein